MVDFTKNNYLAVTYNDPSKTLNMYVYVPGIDLDSGIGHPLKGRIQEVAFHNKSLSLGRLASRIMAGLNL